MSQDKIHLWVITPSGVKLDEEVDRVILRSTTGDVGFLPRHAPYTVDLAFGVMRILSQDVERRLAVYGGLAELRNNRLTVITNDAEWPEDIDFARAQADRNYAEQLLRESTDDLEIQSNQVLLRRSLVQIEVSSYATAIHVRSNGQSLPSY